MNENEAATSSLSGHWFLKFCNKSYLATCLDSLVPSKKDPPDVNANNLMAWLMVIVQCYQQRNASHLNNITTNYSLKQLENVIRLEIIWDRYLQKSYRLNQRKMSKWMPSYDLEIYSYSLEIGMDSFE